MVAGLLAGALLLRLGIAEWMLVSGRTAFPDSELYLSYAASIRAGNEYVADGHRARRTPGYPLFLAACLELSQSSLRAVLWAQSVIGTLSCLIVYWTAAAFTNESFPRNSRLLALGLMAIDPYALVLNGLILSETLSAFLLSALCYLWLLSHRSGKWWLATLFGLVAAALVLVRPSSLLLVPILMSAWWLAARPPAQRVVQLATATIAMLCLLSPWWIRNARLFHRFVPTTLNVGESLYDGVGPQATGASDTSFAADPAIQRLSEVEQESHWWNASIEEIKTEPGRLLRLAVIKVARFWSPWPNESRFRAPLVVLGTTLGTIPLWIFGVIAVWKNRRRWDLLIVTVGPIFYFCALHAVFVSSVRYRVPVGGMFSVLAGAGIAIVQSTLRRKKA